MTYRQRMDAMEAFARSNKLREEFESARQTVVNRMDDFECYMEGFHLGFSESMEGLENPMAEVAFAGDHHGQGRCGGDGGQADPVRSVHVEPSSWCSLAGA